jgi:hypothetical protein
MARRRSLTSTLYRLARASNTALLPRPDERTLPGGRGRPLTCWPLSELHMGTRGGNTGGNLIYTYYYQAKRPRSSERLGWRAVNGARNDEAAGGT